jgi:hypothetical protein
VHATLSPSFSLYLSLSLTGEQGVPGSTITKVCPLVRTPYSRVREREREKERERGEKERKRERGRGRGRKREGEKERERSIFGLAASPFTTFFTVMLIVAMSRLIMLNVSIFIVVMLNVVAPVEEGLLEINSSFLFNG